MIVYKGCVLNAVMEFSMYLVPMFELIDGLVMQFVTVTSQVKLVKLMKKSFTHYITDCSENDENPS